MSDDLIEYGSDLLVWAFTGWHPLYLFLAFSYAWGVPFFRRVIRNEYDNERRRIGERPIEHNPDFEDIGLPLLVSAGYLLSPLVLLGYYSWRLGFARTATKASDGLAGRSPAQSTYSAIKVA